MSNRLKENSGDDKNERMARGQSTQTRNGGNRVDISYEEVYTVVNIHLGMRHHSDNVESD